MANRAVRPRTRVSLGLVLAAALAASSCSSSGSTWPPIDATQSPAQGAETATSSAAATATLAVASTVPTSVPSDAPTDVPTAGPTLPMPMIGSTTITESGSSAGCTAWTIEYKVPVVADVPQADALNAAINAKVHAGILEFKSAVADNGGGAGPCTLTAHFFVDLVSPTLIGIGFVEEYYLGGATVSHEVRSTNLDVVAGSEIAFASLFVDADAAAAVLSARSRTLLTAALGSEADPGFIDPGTEPDMANFDKAWTLSAGGLHLTFQQYQVAPGVDGMPDITIPWADLSGVVDPSGPAGQLLH
jgi:hypothetical protein